MFRSFSAYNFIFLILVLGLCFNVRLTSCNDGEESEEAVPEAESDEAEIVNERKEGDSELDECRHPNDNTREKCCKSNLDIDNAVMKCFVLHQKKMPSENEKNPTVLVKFMSCLVECIYKAKKYIGKGDTLNMKMVKSDANKLHKDNPEEKEYMIEMYQHCEKHAANEWGKLKKNPAAKVIFTGSCKPYYMFVFMCVMEYGKISCPYFKWKGQKDNVEICEELKEKCEKLQG